MELLDVILGVFRNLFTVWWVYEATRDDEED
jgi:hypothetical protein